ncbi:hypothetical protein BDN70DRAFT_899899 [Pholiota conissans]|uniref:Uncharacterized protein n=1 Tax=Pholiota conissans TaxID=109636 RepID=A0A9P5YSR2_9AGAR|nr:hypothetical protein BDN70DRAFT_899899 [Pholiota conissans]
MAWVGCKVAVVVDVNERWNEEARSRSVRRWESWDMIGRAGMGREWEGGPHLVGRKCVSYPGGRGDGVGGVAEEGEPGRVPTGNRTCRFVEREEPRAYDAMTYGGDNVDLGLGCLWLTGAERELRAWREMRRSSWFCALRVESWVAQAHDRVCEEMGNTSTRHSWKPLFEPFGGLGSSRAQPPTLDDLAAYNDDRLSNGVINLDSHPFHPRNSAPSPACRWSRLKVTKSRVYALANQESTERGHERLAGCSLDNERRILREQLAQHIGISQHADHRCSSSSGGVVCYDTWYFSLLSLDLAHDVTGSGWGGFMLSPPQPTTAQRHSVSPSIPVLLVPVLFCVARDIGYVDILSICIVAELWKWLGILNGARWLEVFFSLRDEVHRNALSFFRPLPALLSFTSRLTSPIVFSPPPLTTVPLRPEPNAKAQRRLNMEYTLEMDRRQTLPPDTGYILAAAQSRRDLDWSSKHPN